MESEKQKLQDLLSMGFIHEDEYRRRLADLTYAPASMQSFHLRKASLDDDGDLFPLLSDEILAKLNEDELYVASQVCQRWSALAQDQHLLSHTHEGFKKAWDQLYSAFARSEEQLVKLAEAIVDNYKDQSAAIANLIKTRMDQKSKALTDKANSFSVVELIEQIIGTLSPNETRNPELHTTFKQRKFLYAKLTKQITEFYIYLKVNQDVGEMETNPFVTIHYRADLLKPVLLVTNLLGVTQASLDAAVEEGRLRYEAPLIRWN